MPVIVPRSPLQCSATEVADFVALVQAGGEVIREGLEARVREAKTLFFLRENEKLLGIAALKIPAAGYRERAFEKARATVEPADYPFELGWIFVVPEARGRRLSNLLVQAAIAQAKQMPIFATSRTDNPAMHTPLRAASFVKHGHEYRSSRGNHHLALFVHTSCSDDAQPSIVPSIAVESNRLRAHSPCSLVV